MKVYHSPCQEWGLKVISQRYDLMSSRPSVTRSVPMSVRNAAVLERTLRSALESYKFQLGMMTALFRFSGDSGQIPLELWPSWLHEEENISSVTWCLPSRRLRSAICCQILSSNRRIYLRLPLLTQLNMPQGMCPYIKDHGLGLPRRLRRLSGSPSLVFGIQGTHSIFVCSCSAAALSSLLFLEAFYAPEEIARSLEGVFQPFGCSPVSSVRARGCVLSWTLGFSIPLPITSSWAPLSRFSSSTASSSEILAVASGSCLSAPRVCFILLSLTTCLLFLFLGTAFLSAQ